MINLKEQLLKKLKNIYIFNLSSDSSNILDTIAKRLNTESSIILIKNIGLSTKDFLNSANKIRQLTSIFNSILIIEDRIDVAKLVDADGVFLNKNTLDYENAIKLIDKDKIIGSDTVYGDFCDFVISDKQYKDKLTYVVNSKNSKYKAIYDQPDNIIVKAPYLEFKYAKSPSDKDWYYAKRSNDTDTHDSAVVITTLVKKNNVYNFLLLKTKRPPIYAENKAKYCLESPAGLIGDENKNESLKESVIKELLEETGYKTDSIYIELKNSSTSSGLSSETLTYVSAFVDDDKICNNPISDGGIIVERFFVPISQIYEYLSKIDTKQISVASATICGIFYALKRVEALGY